MSTHTSPFAAFPGEVVLPDFLTLGQCVAWGDCIAAAEALGSPVRRDVLDAALLPGVLSCVQEFRISGLPPRLTVETFPGTPRRASAEFISWLIGLVSALYVGEEVPNG